LESSSSNTSFNHSNIFPQVHVFLCNHFDDRKSTYILIQGFLAILFFRYRDNDDNTRKSVSFFSNVFEIDGRVKETNPISRLLSGRGIFGSGIH